MSAQYGFAFHQGLSEGIALGEAGKAAAVADATSAALVTGAVIGGAVVVVGAVAVFGWLSMIDDAAKAIGEGLADV